MKIKYINFGIASRQGDTIYLHKSLKEYPNLYKAILEHEKEHSPGFCWHDLRIDIGNKHLKGLKLEYYLFILSNPSTLAEFIPFWIYDGNLSLNPLILLFYGLVIALMGVLAWIL